MGSLNKLLLLLLLPVFVTAQFQRNQSDSMHQMLRGATNDTVRMDACLKLGAYYDATWIVPFIILKKVNKGS